MNERLKSLRVYLKLSQEEMGNQLGVNKATISRLEKGVNNLTEQMIKSICREFNVNEEWLRNGNGEMFIEPDTFSLDKYVKQRGMTEEELDIIKGVFEIPADFRRQALEHFKTKILPALRFDNDIAATKEIDFEEYKKRELEYYAMELDAESKGATLSASGKQRDKEGA